LPQATRQPARSEHDTNPSNLGTTGIVSLINITGRTHSPPSTSFQPIRLRLGLTNCHINTHQAKLHSSVAPQDSSCSDPRNTESPSFRPSHMYTSRHVYSVLPYSRLGVVDATTCLASPPKGSKTIIPRPAPVEAAFITISQGWR
jgi:hypothetical protein